MALGEIQTALNGGELSPKLYARTDLAKFEAGAALLRNFIVDFRGGATNRPGTKFIAAAKNVPGVPRLLPFIVSTDAAYLLEFGNLYIRVYLNGTFVTEVVTPYLVADLPLLKWTQSADVLTLVHPSYPPANLSRTAPLIFSYAIISTGPGIDAPVLPAVATAMVAPHSGPYSFGYLITAVDLDGKEESLASNPGVKHSEGMNETTNRVIGLTWTPPAQAVSRYNIYKWGPIDAVTMNPATVWGFIGTAETNTFTDNNIAPDFSKQPPGWGDPFSGGQIQSIVVTNGGAGYDGVSGDWPTAIPFVPLVIVGTGTGAAGYAVIDHATGKIVGAYLTNPGKNYTAATVTANGQGGAGATFALTFSDPAALNPACTAYVQQRRVFAGSNLKPETLVMSETGRYNNFNTTPVSLSTDAIPLSIAGEQVNTIKSMVGVSYGLLLFTTSEVHLLNGGSPYAAITPESVSVQSQSSVGANDLIPLRVNADVLYTQNKGNRVRNLSFAWQKQAFQGSDISALAAHLFDGFMTTEWTWAEEPFKIAWLVRDDGRMISLTYAPDQDVAAWCRHDTQGLFKSVCSIPEGDTNAVYVIVERYIPENNPTPSDPAGNWFYYIERMAERQGCCIFDAWFLDCALGLEKPVPVGPLYLTGDTGNVTVTTTGTTGGAIPDITGILKLNTFSASTWNGDESCVDWSTRRVMLANAAGNTLESFDFAGNATITHIAGTGFSFTVSRAGEPGDAHFYLVKPGTNSGILAKLDQLTLATISTFGVVSIFIVPTDATHWAFPADYDIFSDGTNNFLISFALNSTQLNHEIAILNVDTMSWTGTNFHADEVAGVVCRGLPSGGVAQAFCLANNTPGVEFGVYRILTSLTVQTMTKVGTTNANAIPGWTHCSQLAGICLDEFDGNIIAMIAEAGLAAWNNASSYVLNDMVSKGGHDYLSLAGPNLNHDPAVSPTFWQDLGVSGPVENRLAKFNTTTGAVMWSLVVGAIFSDISNWSDQKISHGTLCYLDPLGSTSRIFHVINTADGTETQFTVNRETNPGGMQSYNDTTGVILFKGTFDTSTGAAPPSPIGGTPTSFVTNLATFGPAPAPPSTGPFTHPGVIQIGCGKINITTLISPTQAEGTVIVPLDLQIPDDPNGAPLPIAAGDWTYTTPVSVLSGLEHLEGKEVWALADGVVIGPLTVVAGSVTLPNAASNIVVGLKYQQQIQTLYLTMDDLQPGSIQGKRKFIPAATLRLDCTKGIQIGQDFNNLTPVPDCGDVDVNFMGLPAGELFSGDAYTVLGAAWDDKGEVCIQQDQPLPVSVLGIIVQVVPGDTGR